MTSTDPRRRDYGQVLRFGLVGIFNTALDFALLFLLVTVFGFNRYLGNVLSTSICLVISFALNKKWTFRAQGGARRQFVAFLAVTLAGLWVVQNLLIWLVSMALEGSMTDAAVLFWAKLVATGGSTVWNFFLYRSVVFRVTGSGTP